MGARDTLLLFDMDGTLTPPRQMIDKDFLSYLIDDLKRIYTIGLIGGSDLGKIIEQMGPTFHLSDFDYVFAENGLDAYKNGIEIGRQSVSEFLGEEKSQKFINYCLGYMSRLTLPLKRGTFIEYRKGMINISPIGRSCSQVERDNFEKYDLEHNIRKTFVNSIERDLPDIGLKYSIGLCLPAMITRFVEIDAGRHQPSNPIPIPINRYNDLSTRNDKSEQFDRYDKLLPTGGQISFDCFPIGWDKSYCLRFVEKEYKGKIHFFGDKTYSGGNDYEIYVDPRVFGHSVTSVDDTKCQLQQLVEHHILHTS